MGKADGAPGSKRHEHRGASTGVLAPTCMEDGKRGNTGCARLTGGMLPGESPGRKRGEPTTFSENHAPAAARRQAKRWGSAGAGRAIEPRNASNPECRGRPVSRRQHSRSRLGEAMRGSAGSENHGTRRNSPPGPGRSFNRPVVVEGPQRKGMFRNR